MKKTTITMLCLAACFAAADTKITWLADVTADRAETVTGVQSGQVVNAVAHIVRTDNPHGVTAPQIGALTNETDTAALAALAAYAAYWPRNATASSWFTFTTNSGAITITGYNIAGGTDVVIPDYINGLPVTEIGANAFKQSGVTSIGGAGNVVTVGHSAFVGCTLLASVLLPQVQTVGNFAFSGCTLLASVLLPQVQTVGNFAFDICTSLASVSLPQAQTVGNSAFGACDGLTSLYFDNDAPTIGLDIFMGIPPNQVTIYVTNPTATGWGATFADMPVVRLPLHADAITLNGDTITEWPVGGGETSIIAPLYESGTNVTVTSTQSVYSVAVTGAGPVGIDWSGLALDGTARAEVTLRLNVTEWGGTNVTFSPSLTFDRTPEILVTGVWEFAASTVDGVATRVRQTWPECCGWQPLVITAAGVSLVVGAWWQMPVAATNYVYWQPVNQDGLVQMRLNVINNYAVDVKLYSSYAVAGNTTFSELDVFQSKTVSFPQYSLGEHTVSIATPRNRGAKIWVAPVSQDVRIYNLKCRDFTANERAAYAAGWRP